MTAHYRFPCGGGSTPVCLACVPEVLRAESATLEDLGGVLHDVAFPGDFCEVCGVSLAPLARVYVRRVNGEVTAGVRLADGREARAIGHGTIAEALRACAKLLNTI